MIGDRYGRFTIIDIVGKNKHNKKLCKCLCDCGVEKVVTLNNLRSGTSKSCGCYKKEQTKLAKSTHNLTTNAKTKRLYRIWQGMIRRCYERSSCSESYKRKGITVQDNWINDPSEFVRYLLELPDYSEEKTLDRVDNEIGYQEGNLKWSTTKQQAMNKSKSRANKTGVTGVIFKENKNTTYVVAYCTDLYGKQKSKSFSVSRYGLLPAFKLAVDHRTLMIQELNENGAEYSNKHGR